MQVIQVKLNPESPLQKQYWKEEDSFYQKTGLKFKEETSEVLHLEHTIIWCWNLDTSENRSQIVGKFWNVMLEKDGEDQLDIESRRKGISYIQ